MTLAILVVGARRLRKCFLEPDGDFTQENAALIIAAGPDIIIHIFEKMGGMENIPPPVKLRKG